MNYTFQQYRMKECMFWLLESIKGPFINPMEYHTFCKNHNLMMKVWVLVSFHGILGKKNIIIFHAFWLSPNTQNFIIVTKSWFVFVCELPRRHLVALPVDPLLLWGTRVCNGLIFHIWIFDIDSTKPDLHHANQDVVYQRPRASP